MPCQGLRVADFQEDLVEILESSSEDLNHVKERGWMLTWFEFRRVLAQEPNPAARLYALAGLTLRDPVAANVLREELRRDSSTIAANLACVEGGRRRRVPDR